MKLYVAGPMSGLPEYNYPGFMRAAELLRASGHEVENPAENPACDDWQGYMRLSLVQISRVDGLAVLGGWQTSRGATLEVHIAHALHLPVLPVNYWLATGSELAS